MTVEISAPPVVTVSPTGVQGPRGNSVLHGTGAPANTLGVDGDWYLDTTVPTALVIYGPKVSGAWGTGQAFGGAPPAPATTVTAETAYGQASAVGTATVYARGDHTHGTPTLPVASTSAAGVVQLDGIAADITALGTQSAGSIGKAADAGHVHPTTNLVVTAAAPTGVAATDLAAINAAISALPAGGGVVQLQAGVYVVPAPASPSSGCINMSVNNSVLRGMGMGVTTIQLAPGSTGVTGIIRTPSGVANSKITFRDLSVNGNVAGQPGSPVIIGFFCGVTPNSTLTDTDISCLNVEIYGCTGYGFDPHERTTRLSLINCVSHDNGTDGAHDGFTLDAQYDLTMIGCVAYGNGRHGFNFVTATTRARIIGCEAYSNTANGFTSQNGSKYLQLSACMSYNNGAAGYVLNGLPQTGQQDNTPGGMHTLTGCQAWSNGTHNYQLVGCSYNTLSSCRSQDASQAANNTSNHFQIDESGGVFSASNTFQGCTWAQTSGVTNAAKNGIAEKTSSDGPSYVLGCSGSGTATGSLSLLNSVSVLVAAHNGTSGGHPASFAYSADAPSRHGYIEWNFPTDVIGSAAGVIMASGTIYGLRLDAQAGQTISSIVVQVPTGGTSLTAGQCVATIVDCTTSTATELARTGDISTALTGGALGEVTLPLAVGFTPTAGQKLAVMLLVNGTTPPTLLRSSGTSATGANSGQVSTSPRKYFTAGTAQTAIASSFALSSTTSTGALTFWCALK